MDSSQFFLLLLVFMLLAVGAPMKGWYFRSARSDFEARLDSHESEIQSPR